MIKCVMLNAHCTLISEIIEVDADGIQLDLLGEPILSKEFIIKAIL